MSDTIVRGAAVALLLSTSFACSSAAPPPPATGSPDGAASATPSSPPAAGGFIAWNDNPKVAMIPNEPARLQEEGGKPVDVNLVVFQIKPEGTSVHLDHVGESGGMVVPSVVLALTLAKNQKLAAGTTLEQGWSDEHDGYALEITEWTAKPWDKKGDKSRQELGKASGKIFGLSTSAGKKRWVAGTFKDALIEQLGGK